MGALVIRRYLLDTATLGLTSTGQRVPIWLEDGGDGRLGPGDWLEFLGESPRGEVAHHHEYAGLNVYWLRDDDMEPARMRAPEAGSSCSRRGKKSAPAES